MMDRDGPAHKGGVPEFFWDLTGIISRSMRLQFIVENNLSSVSFQKHLFCVVRPDLPDSGFGLTFKGSVLLSFAKKGLGLANCYRR